MNRCCEACKGTNTITTIGNGLHTVEIQSCSNIGCDCHEKWRAKQTKLTEPEEEIYQLLDNMITDLYDDGVDVSYFPEEARETLKSYAIKITKLYAKKN